jgi:MYXO-CTERM domain-containing protein
LDLFSAVLAMALAAPSADISACSWDRPGHDPFVGDVPASIDRYTDIPPDVRARLKERMLKRDYDDMVSVKRDSIEGTRQYESEIRDMHFGSGRVCHTVSREKWAPDLQERGLVYCEGTQCILVPTVCRNVSRITALPVAQPPLAAAPAAGPEDMPYGAPGAGPLAADPTAAAAVPDVIPANISPAAGPEGGGLIGPPIATGSYPGIPGGLVPPAGPPVPPTSPVPEPQTWLLWLGGLGAVVGVVRRRRARASS